MEGAENGGSDDGQLPVALRKMIEKMIKVVVISTIHQEVVPIVEDLLRKVVKEEIQSVVKKLPDSVGRNCAEEIITSKERSLQLKFSDEGEVSDPVLTGKEIKGKGDKPMKVSLFDEATGEIVKSGPESSAELEILVLDASGDDNEHNWTHERFNSKIIREDDENKPRFAKRTYISLKEGFGVLENVKFRHISRHTKRCRCRLGARIKENLRGINVQEAWTKSFEVLDSRSTLYKKSYPPSLSDEVWRLENIGKDGDPCKRLEKENIKTVEDFLFLLSVNPQWLKQIVGARAAMWNAMLDHARTCRIGDKKIYLHYPSAESEKGLILDALGGLKGVVDESHYVPINDLPADEKDHAHKLQLSAFKNLEEFSAFKNQEGTTSFEDEAYVLHQFPYRSSVSIQAVSNINGFHPPGPGMGQIDGPILSIPEPFSSCKFPDLGNAYVPTDPGTSSQIINQSCSTPDIPNNIFNLDSLLDLPNTGQPYEPNLGSCYLDSFSDNESLMFQTNPEIDWFPDTIWAESPPHQQINAGAYYLVMLWVVRAKKMASGGIHVQKKQRI